MSKTVSILFLILQVAVSSAALDSRNRVEELFIWKVSDELKLSVPEEKSFSDMMRTLNERRARVNEDLQDVLRSLALSKTSKEKERLLLEQKRLLRSYNELAIEEAEKVQKLFGIDRAAQYFVLKNDLTNRLKMALVAPEKPGAPTVAPAKLGPPQVIEEK